MMESRKQREGRETEGEKEERRKERSDGTFTES